MAEKAIGSVLTAFSAGTITFDELKADMQSRTYPPHDKDAPHDFGSIWDRTDEGADLDDVRKQLGVHRQSVTPEQDDELWEIVKANTGFQDRKRRP